MSTKTPLWAVAFVLAATSPMPIQASAQDWGTRTEYHALLKQSPKKWELDKSVTPPKWPLYVVGIEKLSKNLAPGTLLHRIKDDPKRPCLEGNPNCLLLSQAPEKLAADIRDFLVDPKVQWPTHIVRIQADRTACALFSIYGPPITACDGRSNAAADVDGVWDAFDRLSAAITQHIDDGSREGKPVSHLVLLATGWNTFQDESAKNFAQWADSLGNQGPAGFNPVYVGISWESTWGNMEGAPGGLLSAGSFANKSNDADEIGFTWANQLLNRYLMPIAAERRLPVLVIGHSFGTRIAGAAMHGRTLLRDLPTNGASVVPVTFVALQPAFSSNRVRPGRKEAFYTAALPEIPGSRSIFTASAHDKATAKGNILWGWLGQKPYLSSPQVVKAMNTGHLPAYLEEVEVWKAVCSAENCASPGTVRLTPPALTACSHVPLIDATQVVDFGTGKSGAHSDVYDDAAAQLIFRAMEACPH